MLSIAGNVSPWNKRDIDRFLDPARETAPVAVQKMLTDLETLLKSMSDGLGDRLVTVESTRLDGVEHRTMHGTHLSMIRNISPKSTRIPPAVPLIIKYIAQMFSGKPING